MRKINARKHDRPPGVVIGSGGWCGPLEACGSVAVLEHYNATIMDKRKTNCYKAEIPKGEWSGAWFNRYFLDSFVEGTPKAIRLSLADKMRSNHRFAFTHGDLGPQSILVRVDGTDVEVVGLVDWAFGGWYPEYWEYIKFFETQTQHADWYDYSGIIFEAGYMEELFLHQAVVRCQKP